MPVAGNPLDLLVRRHPVSSWRTPAWAVIALLVALGGWASVARLDEVAVAEGEVVPQSRVKVIQHLEGGIVESIAVTEGQFVAAGDPLIRLGLGVLPVNEEELHVQLDSLMLNRARIEAEAKGLEPVFPADLAGLRPDFARAELEAFEARRLSLESALSVRRGKVTQEQRALGEMQARRDATRSDLGRAREILAISADLLKDGLTSKLDHIQNQRLVEKLEGELRTIAQGLPRVEAAIAEAEDRLREEELKFRREAYEELGRVELAVARTRELLSKATAQSVRTEIRSPIDGVVKNMRQHTIGGIVRPGDPIMEIVPVEENLVVEAQLHPVDRGYVQKGQAATVKISSYDFIRYGSLEGVVIHVAPDSTVDPNGSPFFKVIVETRRSHLGDEPGQYPISPGMQASVDIHTGDRTVAAYLLRPVLKLRHEAFRER